MRELHDAVDDIKGKNNYIEESEGVIILYWRGKNTARHTVVFGKRAHFHYKCSLESQCFMAAMREFKLEKDHITSWGKKVAFKSMREWENFFYCDASKTSKEMSTVVVEEKQEVINFYSNLSSKDTKQLSFRIEDDRCVWCPVKKNKLKRPCADCSRVTYLTYRPRSLLKDRPDLSVHTSLDSSALNDPSTKEMLARIGHTFS